MGGAAAPSSDYGAAAPSLGDYERQEDPATLYGAPAPPPPEAPALAEYGASAPLPAYGFAPQGFGDDLPSYGNRRSGSASNLVPVYVPRNGRAQFNQYHYLY